MKNANDTETIQIVSELKNNPEKANHTRVDIEIRSISNLDGVCFTGKRL